MSNANKMVVKFLVDSIKGFKEDSIAHKHFLLCLDMGDKEKQEVYIGVLNALLYEEFQNHFKFTMLEFTKEVSQYISPRFHELTNKEISFSEYLNDIQCKLEDLLKDTLI